MVAGARVNSGLMGVRLRANMILLGPVEWEGVGPCGPGTPGEDGEVFSFKISYSFNVGRPVVRGTTTTGMRQVTTPIDKLVRGKEEGFGTFVLGPPGVFRATVLALTSDFLFLVFVSVNHWAGGCRNGNVPEEGYRRWSAS